MNLFISKLIRSVAEGETDVQTYKQNLRYKNKMYKIYFRYLFVRFWAFMLFIHDVVLAAKFKQHIFKGVSML